MQMTNISFVMIFCLAYGGKEVASQAMTSEASAVKKHL